MREGSLTLGSAGFGLLWVSSAGAVEVVVKPRPWKPRQDKKRRARLIDEHRKRIGDPAQGGSTRQPIMTAYRQQALACAAFLAEGPRCTSELRAVVPNARSIVLSNVYGWFSRLERGVYQLTPDWLAIFGSRPSSQAIKSASDQNATVRLALHLRASGCPKTHGMANALTRALLHPSHMLRISLLTAACRLSRFETSQ